MALERILVSEIEEKQMQNEDSPGWDRKKECKEITNGERQQNMRAGLSN